jgi:hypothetical protein
MENVQGVNHYVEKIEREKIQRHGGKGHDHQRSMPSQETKSVLQV